MRRRSAQRACPPWDPGAWSGMSIRQQLTACVKSISTSASQAKPPAPPLWLNELWALVGQAFSLPDFCHRLLRDNGFRPRFPLGSRFNQLSE